jgi:hypothetical protein
VGPAPSCGPRRLIEGSAPNVWPMGLPGAPDVWRIRPSGAPNVRRIPVPARRPSPEAGGSEPGAEARSPAAFRSPPRRTSGRWACLARRTSGGCTRRGARPREPIPSFLPEARPPQGPRRLLEMLPAERPADGLVWRAERPADVRVAGLGRASRSPPSCLRPVHPKAPGGLSRCSAPDVWQIRPSGPPNVRRMFASPRRGPRRAAACGGARWWLPWLG